MVVPPSFTAVQRVLRARVDSLECRAEELRSAAASRPGSDAVRSLADLSQAVAAVDVGAVLRHTNAVAIACRTETNRHGKCETAAALVRILRQPQLRACAASTIRALANLCADNDTNRASALAAGAAEQLVARLSPGTPPKLALMAVSALANLVCESQPAQQAVCDAGGVDALCGMLRAGGECQSPLAAAVTPLSLAPWTAVQALTNLSDDPGFWPHFESAGGLDALSQLWLAPASGDRHPPECQEPTTPSPATADGQHRLVKDAQRADRTFQVLTLLQQHCRVRGCRPAVGADSACGHATGRLLCGVLAAGAAALAELCAPMDTETDTDDADGEQAEEDAETAETLLETLQLALQLLNSAAADGATEEALACLLPCHSAAVCTLALASAAMAAPAAGGGGGGGEIRAPCPPQQLQALHLYALQLLCRLGTSMCGLVRPAIAPELLCLSAIIRAQAVANGSLCPRASRHYGGPLRRAAAVPVSNPKRQSALETINLPLTSAL
jgi:hypothetical protein